MKMPPSTDRILRAALREAARQYTGPVKEYRRAIVGTWKWATLANTLVIALATTGIFGQDLNPGLWGALVLAAAMSIVFGMTSYAWAYMAFQWKEAVQRFRERKKTGAGDRA